MNYVDVVKLVIRYPFCRDCAGILCYFTKKAKLLRIGICHYLCNLILVTVAGKGLNGMSQS